MRSTPARWRKSGLCLALILAAPMMNSQVKAQAAPRIADAKLVEATSEVPGDYRFGPGDRLRITVYGETGLTGEYAITSGGFVSFPLIGDVVASNRTRAEIQTVIHDRLASGYLLDPRVAVEVVDFRNYYVLGEVSKPGEYPYRPNLTLEQAIAAAGGFTYRASQKNIRVRHNDQGEYRLIPKDGDAPLALQPGDTVKVGERFF
jgi:polysaccharide export outer membrane protein